MSESALGVNVAATRQNEGNSANVPGGGDGMPVTAGGANAPAATISAIVIVVFGNASDVIRSHADAEAASGAWEKSAMVSADAVSMG